MSNEKKFEFKYGNNDYILHYIELDEKINCPNDAFDDIIEILYVIKITKLGLTIDNLVSIKLLFYEYVNKETIVYNSEDLIIMFGNINNFSIFYDNLCNLLRKEDDLTLYNNMWYRDNKFIDSDTFINENIWENIITKKIISHII